MAEKGRGGGRARNCHLVPACTMANVCTRAHSSHLEGQQIGVVTKALLKKRPCSVSSDLTTGCTSSEPSFTSWSSVNTYTARGSGKDKGDQVPS